MAMLTILELRNLKPGQARKDSGVRGSGSLWFIASGSGRVHGVFRYRPAGAPSAKDYRIAPYDEAGRMGLNLVAMRDKAAELSKLYLSGVSDLKSHFEALEQERLANIEAERQAAIAAKAAQEAEEAARQHDEALRQKYSLAKLGELYEAHLRKAGKVKSANQVKSIFKVHIVAEWPEIAKLPANQVTAHQVAAMVRKVAEAGKERTSGYVRQFLHAAYALAIKAPFAANVSSDFIPFEIQTNPAAPIPTVPVRARDRTLDKEELKHYLGQLKDSPVDLALKLHLYSAGQRMEQLLRARVRDYDADSGILRLWDPKGRRQQPREHRLPLGKKGAATVETLIARARQARPEEDNPPLFPSGSRVMTAETLINRVREISDATAGPPYRPGDIRRTVETLLAGMGISRDIRAVLLSHGVSGVQFQHYDRHSYEPEKRAALERWEQHLDDLLHPKPDRKVVPMRRRKGAPRA